MNIGIGLEGEVSYSLPYSFQRIYVLYKKVETNILITNERISRLSNARRSRSVVTITVTAAQELAKFTSLEPNGVWVEVRESEVRSGRPKKGVSPVVVDVL